MNYVKYLMAGYPVLYLRSSEQERALDELIAQLKNNEITKEMQLYLWKVTKGLYHNLSNDPESDQVAMTFMDSLNYISSGHGGEPYPERVYVMFNVREQLQNPANRQAFRDTAYAIRTAGSHIVLIGGHMDIPEELEDVVTSLDFSLPGRADIKKLFSRIVEEYSEHIGREVSEDEIDMAAENATGLSMLKAENAMALSIASKGDLDIDLLRYEKQLAVKQLGVLEYMHHNETTETLGGFETLKEHVRSRRRYFQDHKRAEEFGLRPPKGLMMVGPPGTGKTLSGKAISAELGIPLYKFDIGSVFKGVVGQSESTVRQALKMAETVAPCVLLFDEFEKGMQGLESSGKTDSGVTSRVVQTILTWMQETTAPIYKVATCNTIRNLDSALFRRGRWDEVFGVDLPNESERQAIYAIHLSKRGRDAAKFDLEALGKASDGFVGAEIEAAVDEALYIAFEADRDVTTADLQQVTNDLVPLSKTDQENLDHFRKWMNGRAKLVGSSIQKSSDKGRSIKTPITKRRVELNSSKMN